MRTVHTLLNVAKRLPLAPHLKSSIRPHSSRVRAPLGQAPWMVNQRFSVPVHTRSFSYQAPNLSNQDFTKLIRKPGIRVF